MEKNSKLEEGKFSKINLLLVLGWMSIIFCFSSIQGDGTIYPHSMWFYIERKGAHIAEFFILTILLANLLLKKYPTVKGGFLVASLLSLLYAVLDEVHQLFVFGREGKITDVGFDSLGIILALLTFWIFIKIRKKIKK